MASPIIRKSAVAIAAAVLFLSFYFGASYYIVTASLAPGAPVCPYRTPVASSLAAEPVELQSSDDITLAAWLLPSSSDRAVVLVHGLDSFGWNRGAPDLAGALVGAGFHVLVLDLRVHGGSGG